MVDVDRALLTTGDDVRVWEDATPSDHDLVRTRANVLDDDALVVAHHTRDVSCHWELSARQQNPALANSTSQTRRQRSAQQRAGGACGSRGTHFRRRGALAALAKSGRQLTTNV